jgi:DUF1680 family protein
MAFDSYSPLYMNTRGRGIGGFMQFKDGGYYGCCLAIGACAVALVPLTAVMQGADGVYVNYLFNGSAKVDSEDEKEVSLRFESIYPADGKGKITVECDGECRLTLKIRKPDWCKEMQVNGKAVETEGYYTLAGSYQNGDTIEISMPMELRFVRLNGKIAFSYGALTLASDEQKSERALQKPLSLGDTLSYRLLQAENGELVRIALSLADGDTLVLSDYQSCGKKWLSDKPLMTAWFDLEEK